ncbi:MULTISPECIES: alpha-amylase family glycosyl hydrolase [unclassified Listeria]|uniref:alpha-amylase family glycosyl hydrolase n=1 Tax=unclassified Listeria TaxID=2642072 RepID=UPI000B58DD80|nr:MULTISPECIES: alpha-amylase family glycosyl hydrolase [unclassified Listeria]
MRWFEKSVFYEVYMKSFCDGNADGFGDFIGLKERLPYLRELGVTGLWLTPFYPSMQVDNGYDVSDYMNVDPIYGTMADFRDFMTAAKQNGMAVIIDIVLNHTAINHSWFKAHPEYYVWKEAPNNWESFFGGSAFTYSAEQNAYYYHSFAKEQVDLNWTKPAVMQEAKQILQFWLEEGVAGFRFDVINNLTVDTTFPDNPFDELGEMIHKFDRNQPGVQAVIAELASFCRACKPDVFLVGEISSDDLNEIASYSRNDLLDVTFNFNFGSIEKLAVTKIFDELVRMEEVLPERLPTLFFGSHDMGRLMSRLANENRSVAKLLAFLMLTARGIPFIYNGEEVGMRNQVFGATHELRDIQGMQAYHLALQDGASEQSALEVANQKTRDVGRGPMLFADGKSFSEGKPWILGRNETDLDKLEMFRYYKRLLEFRGQAGFQTEAYKKLVLEEDAIQYVRGRYLFVANFGETDFSIKKSGKLAFGEAMQSENYFIVSPFSGVVIELEA